MWGHLRASSSMNKRVTSKDSMNADVEANSGESALLLRTLHFILCINFRNLVEEDYSWRLHSIVLVRGVQLSRIVRYCRNLIVYVLILTAFPLHDKLKWKKKAELKECFLFFLSYSLWCFVWYSFEFLNFNLDLLENGEQEMTNPSWRYSCPHVLVATIVAFLFGYHLGLVLDHTLSSTLSFYNLEYRLGLILEIVLRDFLHD